jgi:hypothetical protein
MLAKRTRDWRKKKAKKGENSSSLFITCQSECFSTTAVKTVTAVYLFRPKELLTQIKLGRDSEAKGNFCGNIGKKGL